MKLSQITEALAAFESHANERIDAAVDEGLKIAEEKLKAEGIEPGVVLNIRQSPIVYGTEANEHKYVVKRISYEFFATGNEPLMAKLLIHLLKKDGTEHNGVSVDELHAGWLGSDVQILGRMVDGKFVPNP